MTWLTKWSFGNKAAVIIMALLILGVGVTSYFTLPMEFLPEADNPQVTISVIGQGYDAESMQNVATTPIEKAVSLIKGKKEVYSTSGDGFSQVNINFDSKTNMKEAKAEVQEAVNGVNLPPGLSQPYVIQYNTSMIPISQLSLTFKDGLTKQNMELAEKEILPAFQQIKGVASVQLIGKTVQQVMVKVDHDKLANKQIPLQAVMGALQGKNFSSAIGESTLDGKTSGIKVTGEINSIDTLSDVAIAPGVRLKDVATIATKTDQDSISRVDGSDSLFMIVTKDASSNAVSIGNNVAKVAEEVGKTYPGAKAEVFYASSDMVVTSVNSMMQEVLLGALFATIVILLFLRNIRSTLITIVSIPLSLALTLFLLSRSGVTLNILTLGGVAVAVGRLVDDSIVVIENIFRRSQKEPFSKQLIIDATREVAAAITSSTLTTVAVFLPMGLLKGSLQSFLLPFALTVTYSLLASLLVALTVVPLLSAGLLRNANLKPHKEPKRFARFLQWNLNRKWVPLLLSLFLFVGSIAMYVAIPKGAVSQSNAVAVSVTLDYPPGTPVDIVKDKAIELEKLVLAQPEVKHAVLQLGNSADSAKWGNVSSPTKADMTVMMNKDADAEHFIGQINKEKAKFEGATLKAEAGSFMGGGGSTVTIDLVGGTVGELETASANVVAAIKGVEGVTKVSSNQEEKKPGYTIVVDTKTANAQEVAMQLHAVLAPTPIGSIKLDGQETPVLLDKMFDPQKSDDLSTIPVATGAGIAPLSSVAKIERTDGASTLLHKGGKPYVRISAQVDPNKLSVISAEIQKKTENLTLPEGISLVHGGASADQASDFTELFTTMAVAMGLVYLIMVITFKTLRAPLAIVCSLPLAAIGAVVGLLVSQVSVDITAMFGALMLIGVVVTNAIVLIDRVKQNEQHMTIRDAVVEAAATRMRPILMTAVATICAMLPLLFAHSETGSLVSKSLAVVVIGGLSAATLLTLVIVPVIYEGLHFRKAKKQRIAKQPTAKIAS